MKKAFIITSVFISAVIHQKSMAQLQGYDRERWLEIAELCKPALTEKLVKPVGIAELIKDENAYQGWYIRQVAPIDSIYRTSFKKINTVIVDFGNHYTGYFSLKFGGLKNTPDGPLRFRLTFAEIPSELALPFDPFTGTLSRAWLQDEIVTVMDANIDLKLDRRVSCRYLKIELLASSPYFDFTVADIQLKSVTSANLAPEPLSAGADPVIRDIDRIGLNTLKECMQTVYEDGPKRDRRLWIGDLFLESISNTYSFKNFGLTKRCLYLLAGLTNENGFLHATVFENPEPHPQVNLFFIDYALLFNVTLKEYLLASKDTATALDLWPVAKRQLDIIYNCMQPDGWVNPEKAGAGWGIFFDWRNGLDKTVSIQGLSVFALKETYALANMLHKQEELKEVPGLIKKMTVAARKIQNKKTGLFESGKDKQISYSSQIWMVLGGILSKDESRKNLQALIKEKDAVYPGAPYLYHFFIQSLINAGMKAEAKQYLVDYWGGMVHKGADTFWEVYDPGNDLLSPYNFYPVNSYCHAWSCTALYFIRKYPEVFQ